MTDMPHACELMIEALSDNSTLYDYDDRFREYSLLLLTEGPSALTFEYCPFCGKHLPESRRSQFYERLELLGIEDDSEAPEEMMSGLWWKQVN